MRITLITEFYSQDQSNFSGGVEARMYHLIRFLQQHHQVSVISRSKTHIAASWVSIIHRLIFQFKSIFSALVVPTDIVEGSNFVSYLPAYIVATLKRVPSVAWYADIYNKTWFETMSWPVAISGYILEKISLKLPWTGIIAMSQSTKQKLVQAGIPEQKIKVIYGGVDVDQISKLDLSRVNYPIIITIARLVNYKRVNDVISAFAAIKQKHKTARLIICGDGPELNNLQQQAKQLNLSTLHHEFEHNPIEALANLNTDVLFTGNISQTSVYHYLKHASIFALASSVEGFGLVTIEAMAAGVPWVNADIEVTREITRNGLGGLFYQVGNHQQLSKQINLLLDSSIIYQEKVNECEQIVQQYSWSIISEQTSKYYHQIISQSISH